MEFGGEGDPVCICLHLQALSYQPVVLILKNRDKIALTIV